MSDAASNEVSLVINGRAWGGWVEVRVTRGIERMPGDFDLMMTERWPGQTDEALPQPGNPVKVKIGDDVVITGYIDRYMPALGAHDHSIRVSGRGVCQDLVDCAAIIANQQVVGRSMLDMTKTVVAPFGIAVKQLSPGRNLTGLQGVIPLQAIQLTETPYQIIEQAARWLALLIYEDADGALVLASPGIATMASGAKSGVNVQSAQVGFSVDQRYTEVRALLLSIDSTLPTRPGAAPSQPGPNLLVTVKDSHGMGALKRHDGSPRYRPLVVVSEQGYRTEEITKQRAAWEVARRYGRSQAVTVVVDTWRDINGTLWTPNAMMLLDLPELHVQEDWLIAEVSFMVDPRHGRVAEITLMPIQAFEPAPPPVLFGWTVTDQITEAREKQRPDLNKNAGEAPGGQ